MGAVGATLNSAKIQQSQSVDVTPILSGTRSIHEGCQIRAMHRIVESRRNCRVEVVASCPREGPCTVSSTRAKRRLEKSTTSSQSSSRGCGQVRTGTSGRFAEVGGSQGRCCSISSKFTATHLASKHCCGGASVANRRANFDSGAGRSPCEPFCTRPTNTGSVGFGLPRNRNASVMATLIGETDTNLRDSHHIDHPFRED